MALSRLLQPKLCSRIHGYGFPKPVRWLSSDAEVEKASQVKKKGVPKEQRAMAVESYVKKYMESNSGLFPKVGHIQNVVGGSWYTVKEILTSIKEKMVETTAGKTQYVPDNDIDLHGHHKSDLDAGQVKQCEDKEGNIRPSVALEESDCSSDIKVSAVSSSSTVTSELECSSGFTVSTSLDSGGSVPSLSSFDHVQPNLTQQENVTSCNLSPNVSVEVNNKMSPVPSASVRPRLSSLFSFRDAAAESVNMHGMEDSTVSTSSDAALTQLSGSSSEDDKPSWRQNDIACSLYPDSDVEIDTKSATYQPGGSQELKNLLNLSETKEVYESKDWKVEFKDNRLIDDDNDSQFPGNIYLSSSHEQGRNEQASPLITDMSGDVRKPDFFEHLDEAPRPEDQISRHNIKDLIDCVKGTVGISSISIPKEKTSYWKTIESLEKSQRGVNSAAILQSFDNKERNASEKRHNQPNIIKVLQQVFTGADKISSLDSSEPAGESRLSASNDKEELGELGDESSTMELPVENKAVLKFVPASVKYTKIVDSFQKYGDVLKVNIPRSEEGGLYTTAEIYFKTREGLLNLLADANVEFRGSYIVVEASSKKISIPSLIGDPRVPADVVKNPTRTVKIRKLTPEISSRDVVAALESRGSHVTGFFFGTKHSVAYVEFDDEDDKEAILEEHSIDVRGKKLLVTRIDVPRTTVVRVSFHSPSNINAAIQMCRSIAPFAYIRSRRPNITDVHFKIGEWPNMMTILNSLNEARVVGHKLQARPARVIPPPILETLWHHPEERTHIKKCVKKLLLEFNNFDAKKGLPSDLPSSLLD